MSPFGGHVGQDDYVSTISVEELKAAISAAMNQVREGQAAITAASERIEQAQQSLGAVTRGSAHASVTGAQAALAQANQELEQSMAATVAAAEQAESYAATLLCRVWSFWGFGSERSPRAFPEAISAEPHDTSQPGTAN